MWVEGKAASAPNCWVPQPCSLQLHTHLFPAARAVGTLYYDLQKKVGTHSIVRLGNHFGSAETVKLGAAGAEVGRIWRW